MSLLIVSRENRTMEIPFIELKVGDVFAYKGSRIMKLEGNLYLDVQTLATLVAVHIGKTGTEESNEPEAIYEFFSVRGEQIAGATRPALKMSDEGFPIPPFRHSTLVTPLPSQLHIFPPVLISGGEWNPDEDLGEDDS